VAQSSDDNSLHKNFLRKTLKIFLQLLSAIKITPELQPNKMTQLDPRSESANDEHAPVVLGPLQAPHEALVQQVGLPIGKQLPE
jgi:hypothetical protein